MAAGYVGAGIGQSSVDVCDELLLLGATQCDDEDTGFKVFGGVEMNRNLALEATYTDYGEMTASSGLTAVTVETTALAIAGKGTVPLSDTFALFGKLGLAFWDAEASATGFGSIEDDGTDLTYGLGVELSLSEVFGIRGEWERLDADGDDLDLLSVSAVLRF
jgi:OOP family OmpA-OmpF porin